MQLSLLQFLALSLQYSFQSPVAQILRPTTTLSMMNLCYNLPVPRMTALGDPGMLRRGRIVSCDIGPLPTTSQIDGLISDLSPVRRDLAPSQFPLHPNPIVHLPPASLPTTPVALMTSRSTESPSPVPLSVRSPPLKLLLSGVGRFQVGLSCAARRPSRSRATSATRRSALRVLARHMGRTLAVVVR